MGSKNVIELNGKQYDTRTGRIVPSKTPVTVKPTAGVSMDGFSRRPKPIDIKKQPAKHSATLMRTAVKKPQLIVKQKNSSHKARSTNTNTPSVDISSKTTVDPARVARAQEVAKSKLVSKFSSAEPRSIGQPVIKTMPVTTLPETAIIGHDAAQQIVNKPSSFQNALDDAVSHQQPQIKRSSAYHRIAKKLHVSTKALSISSVSLALLVIGVVVAYKNVPNVAMRVAAARSGVNATLPGYKPSGFAFNGPIHYKPGQIMVSFKSNSDKERNFSVTQATSAWNSETLLENFVNTNKQPYQTYQDGGKTIYIYNGSNATWVDGGVWYRIEGNSSLSSEQLLRLADSI